MSRPDIATFFRGKQDNLARQRRTSGGRDTSRRRYAKILPMKTLPAASAPGVPTSSSLSTISSWLCGTGVWTTHSSERTWKAVSPIWQHTGHRQLQLHICLKTWREIDHRYCRLCMSLLNWKPWCILEQNWWRTWGGWEVGHGWGGLCCWLLCPGRGLLCACACSLWLPLSKLKTLLLQLGGCLGVHTAVGGGRGAAGSFLTFYTRHSVAQGCSQ